MVVVMVEWLVKKLGVKFVKSVIVVVSLSIVGLLFYLIDFL